MDSRTVECDWMSQCAECGCKAADGWALYCVKCSDKQREWVGLTDEEILKLYTGITKGKWDCLMYARAIEAKLKEKNHA